MLLKIGAWMMAAALAIVAGVALVLLLRAPDKPAVANPAPPHQTVATTPNNEMDSYERFAHAEPESGPASKTESTTEPELKPTTKPATEPTTKPATEPTTKPELKPRPEPESEPQPEPRSVPESGQGLESEPRQNALSVDDAQLPPPGEDELARLEEPRRFAPDPDAPLTLSLPSLGVRNAPVYGSDSPESLEAGVAHVPETSMPWDRGAQRNTYLAAHRLGYPGTGSRLLFYELDELGRGDEVILKGRGETYRYRVSEVLVVDPSDSWVMGQVVGRDMVTLQTCTPVPTYEKRLVVRADRI